MPRNHNKSFRLCTKTLNQTFHSLELKEIPIIYFLLKLCLYSLKSRFLMHVTCLQINPFNNKQHPCILSTKVYTCCQVCYQVLLDEFDKVLHRIVFCQKQNCLGLIKCPVFFLTPCTMHQQSRLFPINPKTYEVHSFLQFKNKPEKKMNRYLSPPKIYQITSLNLKVQSRTHIPHEIVQRAQNFISGNLVVGKIIFP